jgi:hypothetical protein
VRELIAHWPVEELFGLRRRARVAVPADEAFVLPDLVGPQALPPVEAALVGRVAALLGAAGSGLELRVGVLHGLPAGAELAVEGPVDGRVFQRRPAGGSWTRRWRRRALLADRRHPTWQAWTAAAAVSPLAAAGALAELLLRVDGAEAAALERLHAALDAQLGGEAA